MATKVERKRAPSRGAVTKPAVDELAILHPERSVTIAGISVTVREYGFVEGLKVRSTAQPFLDALYQIAAADGDAPDFLQVEELIAAHLERMLPLIAKAAGVELAWIEGLSDDDGTALLQTWWLVNSGFFIQRVIRRIATEQAVARLAGSRSTTHSSAPATDAHPRKSDGSPTAS